jgi:hypothetical protein
MARRVRAGVFLGSFRPKTPKIRSSLGIEHIAGIAEQQKRRLLMLDQPRSRY